MLDLSSFALDIEEILEDLRLHWLEREESRFNDTAFTKMKRTGDNIMCCCPYHHEQNPSFGIQIYYPYAFNCFGCGQSGNIAKLVAHALGLKGEFQGLHYILKNYIIVSKEDRPKIDIHAILNSSNESSKVRSVPEEEVREFASKRHPYMYLRGFTERTLQKYEVGYDEKTKSITFPVRTTKGVVRFIARRFVDKKDFLNEKGVNKKDILYGLYYLVNSGKEIKEVYITESITDTLACYQAKLPAVSLMGKKLFFEQALELVKAGIKKVNLFLDNDEAGVIGAIQAYRLIAKRFPLQVRAVVYPCARWGVDTLNQKEIPYKDANDLLLHKKLGDIQLQPFEEYLILLRQKKLIDLNKIFRKGDLTDVRFPSFRSTGG